MARCLVSVVRTSPVVLGRTDPTLEANAFAVAEDVDLTVVLRGRGLAHALEGAATRNLEVAGTMLRAAAPGQDVHGLVESGVRVVVSSDDLAQRGLEQADLIRGVQVLDAQTLADILRAADAVVTW